MTLQVKIYIALALLLLGFGSGFGVRAYIASKDALEVQVAAQKDQLQAAKDYSDKVDARDQQVQALNDRIHTLDVTNTRNLNEKLSENDHLRTDLAVAQRMRFTGASCPKGPATGQTQPAGSVGDGAGVELTTEARQDVFDLRSDIVHDQAKVTYLQRYTQVLEDYIDSLLHAKGR